MPFANMNEVSVGTKLVPDAGFTCMAAGSVVEVASDGGGLYVPCAEGRHYLDGQLDDGQEYIGLSLT